MRPVGHIQGVTLRSLPPGNTLVLEPLGQLSVRQQVVPLDTGRDIDLFGDAPVSGERRFHLTATLNGVAQTPTPVTDQFAPAQFFAMSDDEKLAAPSFETMAAGPRHRRRCDRLRCGRDRGGAARIRRDHHRQATWRGPGRRTGPAYTWASARPARSTRTQRRGGARARAHHRARPLPQHRHATGGDAACVPVWTIQPLGDGPAPALDPGIRTWREHLAALTTLNRATAGFQIVPQYELAA